MVDIKTNCEIEVDIQNPEKRPIPRIFRLNESMDVDLNNKDISLDIPESENDDKTSGIYDLENNMESVRKHKKTIDSPTEFGNAGTQVLLIANRIR